MNEVRHEHRAEIPQAAAEAGVLLAVLEMKRSEMADAVKAAQKAYRKRLETCMAWQDATELAAELRKQGEETRKQIAELRAEARTACDKSDESVYLDKVTEDLQVIRTKLSVTRANEGQLLMPFMRLAN